MYSIYIMCIYIYRERERGISYISLSLYIYIYTYACIYTYTHMLIVVTCNIDLSSYSYLYNSGGRLCTLIGVPCRFSMLSTFSTFANVLFPDKSPRAEGAKTDPPPGYTYEGTQTTA